MVASSSLGRQDVESGSRLPQGLVKVAPIPENDIWIAASALRHGLVLVSRDGHFDSIEGLPIEPW